MSLLGGVISNRLVVEEKRTTVGVRQRTHMGVNALSKRRNAPQLHIVAAFEDTYDTSFAELVCNLLQIFGQPLVIKFTDRCVPSVVDLVVLVSVEAC